MFLNGPTLVASCKETLHGTLITYTELDLILASLRDAFIVFATHLCGKSQSFIASVSFPEHAAVPVRALHVPPHTLALLAIKKKKCCPRMWCSFFCHSFFQAPARHVVAANRPNTKPGPGWLRGMQRVPRFSSIFSRVPRTMSVSLSLSLSLSRPCECCIVSRSHQGCPPGEGDCARMVIRRTVLCDHHS